MSEKSARYFWTLVLLLVEITAVVAIVVAVVWYFWDEITFRAVFTWEFWGTYKTANDVEVDRSAVVRNIGLIGLAILGLAVAFWRSLLAYQQNQTALAQNSLAERGFVIDRYQKGAQMLESDELTVRTAGVFALRELALSDPEDTYILVQSLLCEFVRGNSQKPTGNDFPADLQIALETITRLRHKVPYAMIMEHKESWVLNLSGADLSGANLSEANLRNARLSDTLLTAANLHLAILDNADLRDARLHRCALDYAFFRGAFLYGTDFSNSSLAHATLDRAEFSGVNLSGTNLAGISCEGFSQNNQIIWAFENEAPIEAPTEISEAIEFRRLDETWEDFLERVAW